ASKAMDGGLLAGVGAVAQKAEAGYRPSDSGSLRMPAAAIAHVRRTQLRTCLLSLARARSAAKNSPKYGGAPGRHRLCLDPCAAGGTARLRGGYFIYCSGDRGRPQTGEELAAHAAGLAALSGHSKQASILSELEEMD